MVKKEALRLWEKKYKDLVVNSANNTEFKCSDGWIKNWRHRNNIVYRTKTHSQTTLTKDNVEKTNEFVEAFENMVQKNRYEMDAIVNIDETPVYYDIPRRKTLEKKVINNLIELLLIFYRDQKKSMYLLQGVKSRE